MDYLLLHKDVIRGSWESVKRALACDQTLLTASITSRGEIPLHVAVRSGASKVFIRNLVKEMSDHDLEISDRENNTALHLAGMVGYTEAAKVLVEKNPGLTQLCGLHNKIPVHCAAKYGHKNAVWFLLTATHHHDPTSLPGQSSGVVLLNDFIIAEFYDVAIYLQSRYPDSAIQRDPEGQGNAWYQLSLKPHTFLSGSQLGFLQRLLYKCVLVEKDSVCLKDDLEKPKYDLQEPWKFGFLQHIFDTKLMHLQDVELAKMSCTQIIKPSTSIRQSLLSTPVITAARLGIHEFVLEIIKVFPDTIWSCESKNNRCFFHLAVLFRKEKVYIIVHQMSLQKHIVMSHVDVVGNNILLLAGMLEPSNRISGAAFQLQRELQWFKEVKKCCPTIMQRNEKQSWKNSKRGAY